MLRRTACSMLLAFAATSQAQIGRQRPQSSEDPGYWIGLSIGYLEGFTTTDEATDATWAFGYTSQIRATFEKTVSTGTAVGVVAGFSTAPLTYASGSSFNVACPGACLAKADISQYLAFIRGGTGANSGFSATYNAEGGVTQFTNFREKTTGAKLSPTDGSYDLTFGFGAGFAYSMSRMADLYLEQSYDFVFHKQSATVGTAQRAPRMLNIRGGLRFGF